VKSELIDSYNITIGIYNAQLRENGRYVWLAVALANYLTAVRRNKVAVVGLSGNNAFLQLSGHYNKAIEAEGGFKLFGVKYYPYYDEKIWLRIIGEKYDRIILDNIQPFGNRNIDLLECQKRIMAGSLKPWEAADYKACIERVCFEGSKEKYVFLAEYFERRDIRHLEREKGISFMRLPEAMNPFGIKRSEFGFFEAIL